MAVFLRILALLWSLTGIAHCVTVTIPTPVVNVTAGHSVTLNCAYALQSTTTSTANLIVQWDLIEAHSQISTPHSRCASLVEGSVNQCVKMAYFKDVRGKCSWRSQVYFLQNGQPFPGAKFKNRVIGYNNTGNASITITNMQPQDTGSYKCEVSNFPDGMGQGFVHLTVQVPPSTPHCSIEGHMEVGHSITLICISLQGMPQPVYTWNKVDNGVLKPVNGEQVGGLLTIGNMTKFEHGYYRCTASNGLGSSTCEVDLHAEGGAGIIIGGIFAAVLLATVIFVVVWYIVTKKKRKAQKPATELKTMSTGAYTAKSEPEEPAKESLVFSETPEAKEYRDQPEEPAV
ncbi:V-set and immunoglobulin domain-containing protein 1 isoform X1 [Hyperolius riggenbachi]|uniref:V-set and immunoglobulin domain-containing protein 1 isoform X1 n=1 Tax=Hyperolius riggenbachi TaxID=752182 RepID=UPI0035A37A0A